MKKIYKTLSSSTVIQVNTSKGVRPVYFKNGFIGLGTLRGGRFDTEDEELQKGIESHPRFKSGFSDQIWTDDITLPAEEKAAAEVVVETEQQKTDAQEEVVAENEVQVTEDLPEEEAAPEAGETEVYNPSDFHDVTTVAEARKILKEVYGKSHNEVRSNAQVLSVINELGLNFPNLK
ncbi:MAG: hypothetical protein IJ640_00330 [Prevotella sp.]|nr:hypothetical protein [Paludibacteraceae bacterium]MBR1525092.1 hypothetical protein [Prevotella sp.]